MIHILPHSLSYSLEDCRFRQSETSNRLTPPWGAAIPVAPLKQETPKPRKADDTNGPANGSLRNGLFNMTPFTPDAAEAVEDLHSPAFHRRQISSTYASFLPGLSILNFTTSVIIISSLISRRSLACALIYHCAHSAAAVCFSGALLIWGCGRTFYLDATVIATLGLWTLDCDVVACSPHSKLS